MENEKEEDHRKSKKDFSLEYRRKQTCQWEEYWKSLIDLCVIQLRNNLGAKLLTNWIIWIEIQIRVKTHHTFVWSTHVKYKSWLVLIVNQPDIINYAFAIRIYSTVFDIYLLQLSFNPLPDHMK